MISEGKWSFVGKSKDAYKNKERILLEHLKYSEQTSQRIYNGYIYGDSIPAVTDTIPEESSSTTYAPGSNSTVYQLLRLAKDEMKWVWEGENTYVQNDTSTSINKGSFSYTWVQD